MPSPCSTHAGGSTNCTLEAGDDAPSNPVGAEALVDVIDIAARHQVAVMAVDGQFVDTFGSPVDIEPLC